MPKSAKKAGIKSQKRASAKPGKSKAHPKRKGQPQSTLTAGFKGFGLEFGAKYSTASTLAGSTLKPSFTVRQGSKPDSMIIRGVEPLTGFEITGASGYGEGEVIATQLLNPTLMADSRLRSYATTYAKYVIKRASMRWVPRVSLANPDASGEVLIAFERDSARAQNVGYIFDYQDIFTRAGSVAGSIYSSFTATFVREDLQQTYYCDAIENADPRLTYQGVVYLIAGSSLAELGGAIGYGRVYMDYEVEFFDPIAMPSATGQSHLFVSSGGTVTDSLPFGSAPNATSSNFASFKNKAIGSDYTAGVLTLTPHTSASVLLEFDGTGFAETTSIYGLVWTMFEMPALFDPLTPQWRGQYFKDTPTSTDWLPATTLTVMKTVAFYVIANNTADPQDFVVDMVTAAGSSTGYSTGSESKMLVTSMPTTLAMRSIFGCSRVPLKDYYRPQNKRLSAPSDDVQSVSDGESAGASSAKMVPSWASRAMARSNDRHSVSGTVGTNCSLERTRDLRVR